MAQAPASAQIDAIASAGAGNRYEPIGRAAFIIGRMVAGGILSETEALNDAEAAVYRSGATGASLKSHLANAKRSVLAGRDRGEPIKSATYADSRTPEEIAAAKVKAEAQAAKRRAENARRQQQSLTTAARFAAESKSLDGTTADEYLFLTRNLPADMRDRLSDVFRYHPAIPDQSWQRFTPALLVIAYRTDADGRRVARVQATPLTTDGKRALDADGDKLPRLTFGQGTSEFPAIIPAPPGAGERANCLAEAEGSEKAARVGSILSIAAASIFGKSNVGKARYPAGSTVLYIADGDADSLARCYAAAAAHIAQGEGRRAYVIPSFGHKDIEDAANAEGDDAIRERIEAILAASDGLSVRPPPRSKHTAAEKAALELVKSSLPVPPAIAGRALSSSIRFSPRLIAANGRAYAALLMASDPVTPADAPALAPVPTVYATFLEPTKNGGYRRAKVGDRRVPGQIFHGEAPAVLPADACAPAITCDVSDIEDAIALSALGYHVHLSATPNTITALPAGHTIFVTGGTTVASRHTTEAAVSVYRSRGLEAFPLYPPAPAASFADMVYIGGEVASFSDAGTHADFAETALAAAITEALSQIDYHAPLRTGRATLEHYFATAIAQAEAGMMEQAIITPTGSGKTRVATTQIDRFISTGEQGRKVGYCLPAHIQLKDVEERFNSETSSFVRARRYVGREQDDPREQPLCDANGTVCRACPMWKTAQDMVTIGADPSAICGTKADPCKYSPDTHKIGCYTKFQQATAFDINVHLFPSNMLFEKRPKWMDDINLLFKDEFGLFGSLTERPIVGTLESLLYEFYKCETVVETKDNKKSRRRKLIDTPSTNPQDIEDAAKLNAFLSDVKVRFDQSFAISPGALHMECFHDIDAEALDFYATHIFEYKRAFRPQPNIEYDQETLEPYKKLFSRITTISSLLKAISHSISENQSRSPYLNIELRGSRCSKSDQAIGDSRVFSLMKRKPIHDSYADTPLIYMDATGEPKIAREFWPSMSFFPGIEIPNFRYVRQVYDAQIAASCFTPRKGVADPQAELETRESFVKRMLKRIKAQARALAGRGGDDHDILVVSQLELQTRLTDLIAKSGDKSLNRVAFHHFNALRGVDRFKDVAKVMIIGRLLPNSHDLARMASALMNIYIAPVDYIPAEHTATDRKGNTVTLRYLRHPDPTAQMVLDFVNVVEIMQDIERGRSLLRTPHDPLLVDIVTSWPLPIEIVEFIQLSDLDPRPEDDMAEQGVWLDSPMDRCRAFPSIWPAASYDRHRKEWQRGENLQHIDTKQNISSKNHSGTTPLYDSYRQDVPLCSPGDQYSAKSKGYMPPGCADAAKFGRQSLLVLYKPLGERQRSRLAVFDTARFPAMEDIVRWLSSSIGNLSALTVVAASQKWLSDNTTILSSLGTDKILLRTLSNSLGSNKPPKSLDEMIAEQSVIASHDEAVLVTPANTNLTVPSYITNIPWMTDEEFEQSACFSDHTELDYLDIEHPISDSSHV